jgi:hypothetical protein
LDPQPRAERTCGFLLARLVRITLRDATKLRLGELLLDSTLGVWAGLNGP